MRGRSWLEFVMADAMPMRHEGWMILTRRLTMAFVVLAVANEAIWRTMSTDAWVKIETFGFPVALMVFLFWQFAQLQPYVIEDGEDQA
jgi:intracellular septation protein